MKKESFVFKVSMVCLLLLIWVPQFSVYAQFKRSESINCQIELIRDEYKAADPLTIKFSIVNTSSQTINILKWNTPIEGITADIFAVTENNQKVEYVGKVIKRAAPKPEDYIALQPNKAITGEVNLEEGYAISKSGEYGIQLNAIIPDLGTEAPAQLVEKKSFDSRSLSSNTVILRLKEDKPALKREKVPEEDASPKTPNFVNCSQSQQAILNTALADAQTNSFGAYFALMTCPDSKKATAPRYKKWFGAYDVTRYNTVSNHFNAIYTALSQKTMTFHCDCNENAYAYVYPSYPYHIYLCNAFWTAPVTGTDCKFGVLIHEVSHFYLVASTKDFVYGQPGCANLANNNPSNAINNADSHEYFAENNPSLAMGLHLVTYSIILILCIGAAFLTIYFIRRRN